MILTALMALSKASAPALEYGLQTRPRAGEATEVHMYLALEGDSDGETLLRLPSDWGGGESELWRGIASLSVDDGMLQPAHPDTPDDERRDAHRIGISSRWPKIDQPDLRYLLKA